MSIVLVWRRSGILVPIYVVLYGWIVSHWYDDHRIGNWPMTGWALFYAAITCLLHGFLVYQSTRKPYVDEPEGMKPVPFFTAVMSDHFFYIPVLFWAMILGVLSVLCLTADMKGGTKTDASTMAAENQFLPGRTFNIFNSSDDTMVVLRKDAAGHLMEDSIPPHTNNQYNFSTPAFLLGSYDLSENEEQSIPADNIMNDTSKCVMIKEEKESASYRKYRMATTDPDDYDEAWILTKTGKNMIVVDVTAICKPGRTADEINKMDWVSKVREKWPGNDIIEPLYAKKPEKGQYKVIDMTTGLPDKISAGEKVMLLMLIDAGTEPSQEKMAERILLHCLEIK